MKRKPLIYSCPNWGKTAAKDSVELLLSEEHKEQYEEFETQNKVDMDPNLHWWPRNGWTEYILVKPEKKKNSKDSEVEK